MAMTDEEFFARLAEPFPAEAVRHRPHDGLPYVQARDVMTRLDAVCGPGGWRDSYERWSDVSVLCRLTIRLPDGREITKEDLGAYALGTPVRGGEDPGDREKAGFSDGLKRAAVKFGIAREVVLENYPAPKTVRLTPPEREPVTFGRPASGGDLLKRLKAREEKPGAEGLVAYITNFGIRSGWAKDPRRWTVQQAGVAYDEAKQYLREQKAQV